MDKRFASFYAANTGLTPRQQRFAEPALEHVFSFPDQFEGWAEKTAKAAMKEKLTGIVRKEYGLGPVAWFLLEWLIGAVIDKVVDYWWNRLRPKA